MLCFIVLNKTVYVVGLLAGRFILIVNNCGTRMIMLIMLVMCVFSSIIQVTTSW